MAPQKLTEYERRRLENIKRNDEMLAALKIHSKVSQLSAATKRQRAQAKSYKVSPEKKQRTEAPIVLRRSLRTRGVPPDSSSAAGLKDDFDETQKSISSNSTVDLESTLKKRAYETGPISIADAYRTEGSDRKLTEMILSCSRKSKLSISDDGLCDSNNGLERNEDFGSLKGGRKVWSSVDIDALKLEPENVARLVQGRIYTVRFFPVRDTRVVVVGNKEGDVCFWNIDAEDEDGNGIYMYHPHSAPVSGIAFDSFSLSKMFSCSYDGFVRLMDIEKGIFDLVYSSDYGVFSLSQKPDDVKSLYFSGPNGQMNVWDARAGKSIFLWNLHEDYRINTIDFNSQNTNIIATSSTDGTACIWDLRYIGEEGPTSLTTVSHKRAVHSAYFSPSGNFLATTSVDDRIGLLSGKNYEDVSMIYHNNWTGRWLSPFRGIWGWDDSYIFIGNMKRGIDVISTAGKNVVATLQSEHMTAIPCRFDAHPFEVGMLASATSGGQVYTWRPS